MMLIFFSIASANNNSRGPKLIVWATPIADIICCVVAVILFVVYLKYNGQNKIENNNEVAIAH